MTSVRRFIASYSYRVSVPRSSMVPIRLLAPS
jgi:hypothetical protein